LWTESLHGQQQQQPAQIDYHFQQSIKMDMMAVAYRTDNLLD
jgi:hypothetical protein